MKTPWMWLLTSDEGCMHGLVDAIDPRDAASRLLTSPLGVKLAQHYGIEPEILAAFPANGSSVAEQNLGTCTLACQRLIDVDLFPVSAGGARHARQARLCCDMRTGSNGRFYNVTRRGRIGDGSVGDFMGWVEDYINTLFPENAVEYWAENSHHSRDAFKPFQQMPVSHGADGVHHQAVYVRPGSNEGEIIELLLYMRSGRWKSLGWAKTFGSPAQNWLVARACSAALEDLITWSDVPVIVEMAAKLPRQQRHYRRSSLCRSVVLAWNSTSVRVATADGDMVFDERTFADAGNLSHYGVAGYLADWATVLASNGLEFELQALANT